MPCVNGHKHKWERPYEIVGGIKENPGVWGRGQYLDYLDYCPNCGSRRHSTYDIVSQKTISSRIEDGPIEPLNE